MEGHYDHKGSASNMMCLPLDTMDSPTDVGGNTIVYAVEYHSLSIVQSVITCHVYCVKLLDEMIK